MKKSILSLLKVVYMCLSEASIYPVYTYTPEDACFPYYQLNNIEHSYEQLSEHMLCECRIKITAYSREMSNASCVDMVFSLNDIFDGLSKKYHKVSTNTQSVIQQSDNTWKGEAILTVIYILKR